MIHLMNHPQPRAGLNTDIEIHSSAVNYSSRQSGMDEIPVQHNIFRNTEFTGKSAYSVRAYSPGDGNWSLLDVLGGLVYRLAGDKAAARTGRGCERPPAFVRQPRGCLWRRPSAEARDGQRLDPLTGYREPCPRRATTSRSSLVNEHAKRRPC